jgi:hypothetical protein
MLFTTPDGKRVIIGADLAPSALTPLLHELKVLRITSVNAIVLTGATANTESGLSLLIKRVRITGPIVLPYDAAAATEWWAPIAQHLSSSIKNDGLDSLSWKDSSAALKQAVPQADIEIYSPDRSPWEIPVVAASFTYKKSSFMDFSSLTPKQIASMTGRSDIEPCRVLAVDGQDAYVSKEILALIQPEVVLLTGASDVPPGDNTEMNIQAADAEAITLAATPPLKVIFPASDTQQLKTTQLH